MQYPVFARSLVLDVTLPDEFTRGYDLSAARHEVIHGPADRITSRAEYLRQPKLTCFEAIGCEHISSHRIFGLKVAIFKVERFGRSLSCHVIYCSNSEVLDRFRASD